MFIVTEIAMENTAAVPPAHPLPRTQKPANLWHFVPASRAREGNDENPAIAGLICRELVSELISRSLQGGFMQKRRIARPARLNRGQDSRFPHTLCVNPARCGAS